MNNIKFLTDSASDIPVELEQKYNISIMPFPVTVDGKGYFERIDFDFLEFYEIVANCREIPKTAQLTVPMILEEYASIFNQGYAQLVHVTINSKGSGTYHSALAAKEQFFEEYPDAKGVIEIHIMDSKTYAYTYGYAVVEAAKKAERGASLTEILDYLTDWFDSSEVYFASYNLDFAKKSGRISCTAAFVGELMGLRPILKISQGEITIIEKVRGDKNIIPGIVKHVLKNMIPQTPYFCVEGSLESVGNELGNEIKKAVGYPLEGVYNIGACITCNSGPKVVGVIIKGKKKI